MTDNPYAPPNESEQLPARRDRLAASDGLAICVHTLLGLVYSIVVIAAAYEISRFPKHGISSYVTTGMMAALFIAICIQAILSFVRRYRHARVWLLVSPLLLLYWLAATWL